MHQIVDGQQQLIAQRSAGMQERVILFVEAALFQEGDGECVSHGQHGGGAGRRRQSERTGLFRHAGIQHKIRSVAKRRIRIASNCNQSDTEPLKRRQQFDQFVRLAAVGERQHHIFSCDHTQIAVDAFGGVQINGRRASARQRRRQFARNHPGFTHPGDDDAVFRVEQLLHHLYKRLVQPGFELLQCLPLNPDDLLAVV
ncbi:MAG: hypothetical protein MAGBODY4_00839 [Candidatus Marinimicrobia bacterium]|nr:hypothetical protein [Candidatus Neomarinimicrobiota bacterium]